MISGQDPRLGGERIVARYAIAGSEPEARRQAADLCVEQTVEFPRDLISPGPIRDQVIADLEDLRPLGGPGPERWEARVAFAAELAGGELTQLLNLLFGNISIKPGIRLLDFALPPSVLTRFRGPRFGRAGLRTLLDAPERPLVCTALKPMGLSPAELAELAYAFALGGVDLIKDDHGLADQPFCPYDERVARCADAVARANAVTGGRCLYLPNVTADAGALRARALRAREVGAGGLLVSPGLVGLAAMRALADDAAVGLPILSHPALQGAYVVHPDHGISHRALFGRVLRLAGADACIFPNYGGRFSFSESECRDLAAATASPMGHLRAAFPVPAGGMSLQRIPEMCTFYGRDTIFLIGGDLHRHGDDLAAGCRAFRRMVE